MSIAVGYIPYLNMVPFHQGFGPGQEGSPGIPFRQMSPRMLGIEAEAGRLQAGAMSLMDTFRLENRFEPLGDYGVGVKQASSGSVLLFSKVPLSELEGLCAVTDETSTSVRLLQVLVEKRHARPGVSYGRVASATLYDGSAEALLLIGDEALRARAEGLKGLPCVTDLATEWFNWQKTPFVFARWMVAKDQPEEIKVSLQTALQNSLESAFLRKSELAKAEAEKRGFGVEDVSAYWDGFDYQLTSAHHEAIESFKDLVETVCLPR